MLIVSFLSISLHCLKLYWITSSHCIPSLYYMLTVKIKKRDFQCNISNYHGNTALLCPLLSLSLCGMFHHRYTVLPITSSLPAQMRTIASPFLHFQSFNSYHFALFLVKDRFNSVMPLSPFHSPPVILLKSPWINDKNASFRYITYHLFIVHHLFYNAADLNKETEGFFCQYTSFSSLPLI